MDPDASGTHPVTFCHPLNQTAGFLRVYVQRPELVTTNVVLVKRIEATNDRLDTTIGRLDKNTARLDMMVDRVAVMAQQFGVMVDRLDVTIERIDVTNERLQVVESTLIDMVEQQRFVVRYTKATSERGLGPESRVTDLESRVTKLEPK